MSPLRLPLWAKWALSLGVGLALAVALVVFVEHNNNNSEAAQNPAAVERANREASIVVAQDQAPHVARIRAGSSSRAAITRAIHDDVTRLVNRGILQGPLRRVTCRQTASHAGRVAFSCHAFAAEFNYPFLGVVDAAAKRVTYCKRDEPPVPSMNVPVSPRCRE